MVRNKTSFENEYGASNVNYVIGAPSVELYFASYNAKYNSTYSADFRAAGLYYTYPGYLYNGGWRNVQSYSSAIPTANAEEGMYLNTSTSEWLASPLSGNLGNEVCLVNYGGGLNYDRSLSSYGVAPLVSLKSGVDLTTE